MNWGDLRSSFRGVAWKRLTAHEVDPVVSHGHEFQGVQGLRTLLGSEARRFTVTYMLLQDDIDDIEAIRSEAQWYDSRINQPQRSPEWRLYYPAEVGLIQSRMHVGDLMVTAVTRLNDLVVMLAAAGSTREAQLKLLFQIEDVDGDQLVVRPLTEQESLSFVAASILEELGLARIAAPSGADGELVKRLAAELARIHPISLPPGQEVSALVRRSLPIIDTVESPDDALVLWIETEEALFRAWEDGRIARRLDEGFLGGDGMPDVGAFRTFSMSLRQSRVSRAGGALEQHFEAILVANKIEYAAKPSVDGGERPDFLFPGKTEYDDPGYPATKLRMLGAKFTAKDRWRQVLSEASRISPKHLLTLEAPISRNQLDLMEGARLQLVIPRSIQALYPEPARHRLRSVEQFLAEVKALRA